MVTNMERSLAFYRDLLGLTEERNLVAEGEFISRLVGYPEARLHLVYLGTCDLRHAIELIQYLNPPGKPSTPREVGNIGAAHIGLIVDDVDVFCRHLSSKGVRFINPPAVRPDTPYPWARKACYLQDPDGNWLEFIEREPTPPGASVV